MQRTSFILAMALLVVAATLAVTITTRESAREPGPEPTTRSSRGPESPGGRFLEIPASIPAKSARPGESPTRFSVRAPEGHPRHALLAETAEKVESEALFQLDRLSRRLQLTGEQRRRLFPILARTSRHYDPALEISGLPVGTSALVGAAGNRAVEQVLEPPQRDQLVEDAITEQVLWQGIIDKLRQRLDEETPQIPDEVAPVPESSPAPRGRRNLFDVLEPQ